MSWIDYPDLGTVEKFKLRTFGIILVRMCINGMACSLDLKLEVAYVLQTNGQDKTTDKLMNPVSYCS